MLWDWILALVACILGLGGLLALKSIYNEFESWKQNKPSEPSRFYIIRTRIAGGVMLIGGILLILALLFL